MSDAIETITVYMRGSSATYLADEYMRLGEQATPIKQYIHPNEEAVVTFSSKHADGFWVRFEDSSLTLSPGGDWNITSVRLLTSGDDDA